MHDIVDVEMIDAKKNLFEDLEGLLLLKSFFLFENVEKFLTFDKLCNKVEMFLVLVETITHHYVGMILSYILGTISLRI